jgi:uncharacterized protein YpmS
VQWGWHTDLWLAGRRWLRSIGVYSERYVVKLGFLVTLALVALVLVVFVARRLRRAAGGAKLQDTHALDRHEVRSLSGTGSRPASVLDVKLFTK